MFSAQWGVSRFGNPVLVVDGWRFRKNGKVFDDRTSWLCIKSDLGCKCYAVTSNNRIVAMGYQHEHTNVRRRKRVKREKNKRVKREKNKRSSTKVKLEPFDRS